MPLRDDLYSWLSTLPAWQRDLARRLAGRAHLGAEEYAEALLIVRKAHGAPADGRAVPDPSPLTLEHLPTGASTGAPRLTAFGRLRNVGTVSGDHELHFLPEGLTVIYGQNAVGKSSYVRALKRVCRAVDCESELRGNVFAPLVPGDPTPTAMVEFSTAAGKQARQLDLSTPPELGLGAISVFDAQCAELYLDGENTIAFVPTGLRLLARLAATQDRMRKDLEGEIDELTRQAPSFGEFTAQTAVGRLLDGLSARTDLDAVAALASVSDAESARQSELRAVIASADAKNARADAQVARQDARQAEEYARELRDVAARSAQPARDALRDLAERAASTEAAVELAAREFEGLPVKGVGGDPWRLLWRAAVAFATETEIVFPPVAGGHCPLCLQEITPDAAARLAHFQEHIQSTVRVDATAASAAVGAALAGLEDSHVEACRGPFLAALVEREPDLHAALDTYLTAVASRAQALRAAPLNPEVLPLIMIPVDTLEDWGRRRGQHADDPEKERTLRAELAELDARERLATRAGDVERLIETLKTVQALQSARAALATNRITTKQRQLSEELVTGALDARLKQELEQLDCMGIPVDLHPETRVGETHLALRLAGAHGAPRVSEIASEGEQRALALSFFLAEVASSEGDGGIVVDDPVSSLDDERRDYIANRLVAESKRRQVIVLTHDLPFMLDLLDRAEVAGIEPLVEGVWRLGGEVGRVDQPPPFKAMKLKERIAVLERDVEQWDAQDPPRDLDEAWRRVCDLYARLRTTWERAVEERLFKGVVTRFQRNVKTLALDDVVITDELKARVKAGMSRCSTFVHDEPPAVSTSLPDRATLARDVEQLREFVKLTK